MISDWSSKTILVAEDEQANFLFIEKILKETNVTVIHAEDGVHALELLEIHRNIDLVLMDIYMPRLDGFAAAAKIRVKYPKMPLIAQTFLENQIDPEKIAASVFDHFLIKPINITKLLVVLDKYLKANPQSI